MVCCEGLQDAHKASGQKALKGRKRRFAPLETKHTVTSVVWLPDSNVVASSGEGSGNELFQCQLGIRVLGVNACALVV